MEKRETALAVKNLRTSEKYEGVRNANRQEHECSQKREEKKINTGFEFLTKYRP